MVVIFSSPLQDKSPYTRDSRFLACFRRSVSVRDVIVPAEGSKIKGTKKEGGLGLVHLSSLTPGLIKLVYLFL